MRGSNFEFKRAGIENLITRNYHLLKVTIDLESEIDQSLTMPENWYNIKPKVLILSGKSDKYLNL